MARRKKIEPANTEAVGVATVEEATATEAAPAVSPESAPAASAEESAAASEPVPAAQEETEKPARRRGGRRPKNASAEETEKPARKRGGQKPKEEPAETPARRRGGRKAKPAEEKSAEKAEKKLLLPRRSKVDIPDSLGVYVQYQGGEVDMSAIVEAVKADFVAASKHKRITSLKLYVKPEENAVYYVANDTVHGKVVF